jgi:hypothetical protein
MDCHWRSTDLGGYQSEGTLVRVNREDLSGATDRSGNESNGSSMPSVDTIRGPESLCRLAQPQNHRTVAHIVRKQSLKPILGSDTATLQTKTISSRPIHSCPSVCILPYRGNCRARDTQPYPCTHQSTVTPCHPDDKGYPPHADPAPNQARIPRPDQ